MKSFGSNFGTSNGYGSSNGHDGNGHSLEKRPGDIEEEIQMTRARMQSTIEAIKKDLSPGQIVDQVMHSLKDGKVHDVATSTFSSVGHLVRENPLPAALIGVGIVWLAASSGKKSAPAISGRSTRAYVEGAGQGEQLYSEGEGYFPRHHEFEGQRTEGAYGGSYESFEGVDEGADIEGASEGGRLAHVKDGAKEKVSGIAHGARARIGGVGSKIGGVAHGARSKISGATHGAAHKIGGAATYTRQKATAGAARAKQATVQGFDAQPLVVGAIAIGVGALLGSLIPSTQREDQLLGAKRDELKRKADEVGAQMLGRVKETVEQGAQKVKGRLDQAHERAQQKMQQGSAQGDVGNVAMGATAGAAMAGVGSADLGMADLGNVEASSYPTQASAGTFANRGDVEVPQQSGPQATLDDGDVVDDPDTFGGP